MAAIDGLPRRRRLILDASAVRALADGDPETRAALLRAARDGYAVVIPTPVLAQLYRGVSDGRAIDSIIDAVDAALPTSEEAARLAGRLQARTGTEDTVQAIVGAEAMLSAPAVILSHGPEPHARIVIVNRDSR
jgi:predicted nucleic acid-binding protein